MAVMTQFPAERVATSLWRGSRPANSMASARIIASPAALAAA
jgi:hypothetical protein